MPSSSASRPRWAGAGRATASYNWTPSPTSVRSTIAEHAVANHNYFPPDYLRDPFGNTRLQSTSESIYTAATNHNSFLNRTTQLRNSRSASGLSFVRDIAESIPLPADGQLNLITRKPNQSELDRRTQEALAQSSQFSYTKSSAALGSGLGGSNDSVSRSDTVNGPPISPMIAPASKLSSAEIGNHRGAHTLQRPAHARRKVFIDAAFNSSNFASSGIGLTSELGVLKAQSFFVDKNRPFGDRPNLFKGESHSYPKFAIFSTKQTMKRHFLPPRVGSKDI